MERLVELAAARAELMSPEGRALLEHAQAIVRSRSGDESARAGRHSPPRTDIMLREKDEAGSPEARAPAREDGVEDEDEDETQGPITVVCVDDDGTLTELVTTDPFKTFRDRYGRWGELVRPDPSGLVPAGTVLVVAEDASGLERLDVAYAFPLRSFLGTIIPIGPLLVAKLDPASECLFASAEESVKNMIKAW